MSAIKGNKGCAIFTDRSLRIQKRIVHICSFLSLRGSLISIADCTLEMLWQTAIAQGQSAPRSGFILSICSPVSFFHTCSNIAINLLLLLLRKNWKLTANTARLPALSTHTLCVHAAVLWLHLSPTHTRILPGSAHV